jgi:hypothetical protein
MRIDDLIKRGKVRKTKYDKDLIDSLLSRIDKDLKLFSKIKIDNISSGKVTSNYFDILRCVLEAISLKKGFKIYQHDAVTLFLIDIGEYSISRKFDKYRKIRNKINYYGGDVSIEEAKDYILDIKEIINYLIDKYLRGVK